MGETTCGGKGLVLMGGAMSSKSLIHFLVDGWGCVPFLLFDLRPNYGGGHEVMETSFRRSHTHTAMLSVATAAGHCGPTALLEIPRHLRASLGQSLWGHCSFLLAPGVHSILFVPSKSLFPQSCVSSGGSMVGLTVPRRQGSHLFLCLFVLTAPQDMRDLRSPTRD